MGTQEVLLGNCFWRLDSFKEFGIFVCRFVCGGEGEETGGEGKRGEGVCERGVELEGRGRECVSECY